MDIRRHPTPSRTRALVVGESLTDIIRPADPTQPTVEMPGGSPMNVSIGLARQGVDVQFYTELGADRAGDRIEERLVHEGVDLLTGPRNGCTAIAYAAVRPDGSADYRFDLEWNLPHGIPPHSPVDVVHVGSLAAAIEPATEAIESLMRSARAASTISYDPNIRPAFERDLGLARLRVERQARLADIVKASDEDLAHLYGSEPVDSIAQRWLDAGAALVVITRAHRGMLLITRTARIDLPGRHADIVDTIGAGDATTAGLLAGLGTLGLLGADQRERLRSVEPRTLRAVGEWAQQSALLTIERAGAEPPTSAETRDALHDATSAPALAGTATATAA